MIRPARRVKVMQTAEREAWLIAGINLVAVRVHIAVGEEKIVYIPSKNDFMCQGLSPGEATSLRSATIVAPGGEVEILNAAIDHGVNWPGSLLPVGYGVHLNAQVTFRGLKDSFMHCIAPRDNLKGFTDKTFTRVELMGGQSLLFGEDIIGFAVLYGKDQFEGFLAEPGDTYTAFEDTVLAVVTHKEVE